MLLLLTEISWGLVAIGVLSAFIIGMFLEEENIFGASLAFIIAVVLTLGASTGIQGAVDFVKHVPENYAYFLIYIAAGVAWSVYKWIFYVRDLAKKLIVCINRVKDDFHNKPRNETNNKEYFYNLASAINNSIGAITKNQITSLDFTEAENITAKGIIKKLEFTPSNKKAIISSWILYWPASLIVTFLRHFVIDLIDTIIETIRGVYNKISVWAVERVLGDVADEAAFVKSNTGINTEKNKEA